MNDTERYEFDRQGYIVIEDMLDPGTVSSLSAAVDELEAHALPNLEKPPRKVSPWGPDYHRNLERGYHVDGSNAEGRTVIIEDFWNADARFDALVNDARTMAYIGEIVQGRSTINNSEIRIRYRGNLSGLHGGMRPENQKYRYGFNANGIDCMMVRMVYFIHDVSRENGAFCVIPGTHKTNLPCPYDGDPDGEPGVVALEVKAGDAILFTENLRHGGVTNRSGQVRKTIHVGYGPYWMLSQNQATMDELPYVTEATFARWDDDQRALFKPWHSREAERRRAVSATHSDLTITQKGWTTCP